MNLKDICVDLKIAKELKEKGFSQDSLFYHVEFTNGKTVLHKRGAEFPSFIIETKYSAPTTDELLAELPVMIEDRGFDYWLQIDKLHKEYQIIYANIDDNDDWLKGVNSCDEKLPNMAAKRWIYLKDNGLLK